MTSWPNIGKGLRRGMKTPARPSRGRIEWAKDRPRKAPAQHPTCWRSPCWCERCRAYARAYPGEIA